ncbi:unnamed protein product [Penicillium salamii]|uniref:Uncharacterized protein n=1 Tax=Penicillium salamii TaxID=1612424 RepID=A0A9W4I4L2_9EURO|nr:unnamed protein product [Penicillium salamii]CAG7964030.1 unnamed protein product [Penicillium salamii]CAG8237640.1 unnamed protein product [Penicillium salamii]CAG8241158.1 unnamed protein product [Penicillium salamii]CAG8315022.1 unnamed protein product [Penicillium salamii]
MDLANPDRKLQFSEPALYKRLRDVSFDIRPQLGTVIIPAWLAIMGGIRRLSYNDQRQSFRSRLQRALSLSSSESEDIRSPSRSAAGDTTEDEASFQENDSFGNDRSGSLADDGQEYPSQNRSMSPRPENELELPRQDDLSGDCSMIAFQCVADLDIRTKLVVRPTGKEQRLTFSRSMQKSLDNQNSWMATIRSDLDDIRSRLAVVETAMEMVAKEGENDTTEDNATRRTLRSQR